MSLTSDIQKRLDELYDLVERALNQREQVQSVRPNLTVKQAAARLGVTTTVIRRLIAYGRLPAVDVSLGRGCKRRYRIRLADLEAFEASRTTRVQPVRTAARRRTIATMPERTLIDKSMARR